jgi:hypothetical protein
MRSIIQKSRILLWDTQVLSSREMRKKGEREMGNFEEFGRRIDAELSRLKRINNFETFGKHVDEELHRVKNFVKEDVGPETEKRTAQFLREVSEKIGEAAAWVEARHASRGGQNPKSNT